LLLAEPKPILSRRVCAATSIVRIAGSGDGSRRDARIDRVRFDRKSSACSTLV